MRTMLTSDKMRTKFYEKNFQSWIKGVLALDTTRDTLLDNLREMLGSFLLKYKKSDLQQFAKCLKSKPKLKLKMIQKTDLKERNKKQKYTCNHGRCGELFHVFLDKHKTIKKEKFVWEVQDEQDTNEEDTGEENESELTEEEILLQISRLYMYDKYDERGNDIIYKGLDDLDILNVINIMRSCAICEIDGDDLLYEEVSKFRNEMMHSPNNQIEKEYLGPKIEKASSLIELFSTSSQTTHTSQRLKDALLYLKDLGEKDFIFSFPKYPYYPVEEYQRVFRKSLQIVDNLLAGETNKEDLNTLQETLKTMTHTEPTDISKKLEGKPHDFKKLVKNCVEKKKAAVELDLELHHQGYNKDHDFQALYNLQSEISQDLDDICRELKKSDEEDLGELLGQLHEENSALKRENQDHKSGLKKTDEEVLGQLQEENSALNRENQEHKEQKKNIDALKAELEMKEYKLQNLNRTIDELRAQAEREYRCGRTEPCPFCGEFCHLVRQNRQNDAPFYFERRDLNRVRDQCLIS